MPISPSVSVATQTLRSEDAAVIELGHTTAAGVGIGAVSLAETCTAVSVPLTIYAGTYWLTLTSSDISRHM